MKPNDLPDPLYALSFWQPWAWAIFHGKPVENRGWYPPRALVGKIFAVHAAKRYDNDGFAMIREQLKRLSPPPSAIARGAVVGLVRLTGAQAKFPSLVLPRPPARAACGCGGIRHSADCVQLSPWFCGPVGWLLAEPVELARPVPCRGRQGLWRLDAEVRSAIAEQLAARAMAALPAACGDSTNKDD